MSPEPRDEAAISEAVPRWIAAHRSLNTPEGTHRRSQEAKFQGPTADDILAKHGIDFEEDRKRYGRMEAEVRHRAKTLLGVGL
jgi:hypothetical protein